MVNDSHPNYPDFVGYLTRGARVSSGMVDAAAAVRPSAVKAGNPAEVLVLLQNNADTRAHVRLEVTLPEKDAGGSRGQFLMWVQNMTVEMRAAEVGYAVLPFGTLATIAPSDQHYRIGVEINAEVAGKPISVRQTSGGGVNLNYYFGLAPAALNQLAELKALNFSAEKRRLLSSEIAVPLIVEPGKIGRFVKSDTNWVSLWSLMEHTDVRPLLERHHKTLREEVLARMDSAVLYPLIISMTRKRLTQAGYQPQAVEVVYITRLLLYILEMARGTSAPEFASFARYGVEQRLEAGWNTEGIPITLPFWCRSLLQELAALEAVERQPIEVLLGLVYDDLLRDAIAVGFTLIQDALGEQVVNSSDIQRYGKRLIRMMWDPVTQLSFGDVYLPLVLGGVLVDERLSLREKQPLDTMHELLTMIHAQESSTDEGTRASAEMAQRVLLTAMRKYGYHL